MQENKSNVLTLEDEKKLTMTGVASVDSFSDQTIHLTVNGHRVIITGERLKILSFSEGSGNFSAVGEVTALKFGGGKRLSKLLK